MEVIHDPPGFATPLKGGQEEILNFDVLKE